MKADVVIAFYRQAEHWKKVVAGLRSNASYIRKIYVVNDEEWEGEELPTFGLPIVFLSHAHEGFGICKSFNQGVEEARADRVFMTAADCVMPPGYLRTFLLRSELMVTGPVSHVEPALLYPKPEVLREDSFQQFVGNTDYRPWQYVRGAARLVDREAFLSLGGFDVRFDERNYEDWEFTARWCTRYGDDSVGYCKGTPIWHLGDPGRYTGPLPEKSLRLLHETFRAYEVARLERMPKVVVDFDDLCDNTAHTLTVLEDLKVAYPNFKVTLFAIPARCSQATLQHVAQLNEKYGKFIALAPHGWRHTRGECYAWTSEEAIAKIKAAAAMGIDAPLFKAPAWLLDGETYHACEELGYTVYNPGHLGITNHVHGHLSNTTGNYIKDMLADGRLAFKPDHIFQWAEEVV